MGLIKFCNYIGLTRAFKSNSNVILMFHSICDSKVHKYDISPDYFYSILKYLTKNFQIVDLPEILEFNSQRKKISLTFDDGLQNFYHNAFPIIREFKVPVTVFLNSFFIGNQNNESKLIAFSKTEDLMTENQIRELINSNLIIIGNHSKTHLNLGSILDVDILKDEIIGGKKELEQQFGINVDRFCYPHGKFNPKSLKIVSNTHKLAVCTIKRNVTSDSNLYLLPRINGAQNWTMLKKRISETRIKLPNLFNKLMTIMK